MTEDPTDMNVDLPEFLDISWGWRSNEPKLKLLTENDGVVYRDLPFRPYCYMRRDEVTEDTLNTIRELDETATIVEDEDYYQGELYRVHVSYPGLIRDLREAVDIETLQSDVPYSRRVLIDLDESVSEPSRILSFDLEVKADEGFPDVEAAEQPILTIAAVGSDGREFTFGEDDERETIRQFLDVAADYRAIMGWNSIRFDFPYLQNRCRNLDDMAEEGDPRLAFDPFSFVHVDAFPTYRRILMKGGQSYALEDVGAYEFGEEFEEYPEVDYSALEEMFNENRDRLLEYNLEDARVVKRLNDRYQFKKITFGILAKRGHCRPSDIFFVHGFEGGFHGYREVDKASNTLIEGIVMSLSNGDNGPKIVWPNQIRDHEVEFTGAKVLEPDAGLHYNALTLDYSSMYPSIIDALNIGPETYRADGSGEIKAPTGTFVKEPKSRFSMAYHVMKDERDTYTHLKKSLPRSHEEYTIVESLDAGLKTYVNTFYGVIGSGYSRFYSKPVAEAITLMGQNLVDKLAELAEERDLNIIYGDTDSVIIGLGKNPPEDPVEYGKRLAEEVTAEIKQWVIDEYNGFPDRIDIGLDEVYETFYIPEKKKRYAGMCVWDGAPCYEFDRTGFQSVRGDTSEAVAEFVDELLKALLLEQDVWSVVEKYRNKLYSGELDDSLVNAVSLRKPVEEYDSRPPHVRVAEECDDNIRVGDQVPYLKYGSKPEEVVYAPNGAPENYLTQAAYDYIWEKKFKKPMTQMGIEKHEKTTLSDFVGEPA